MKTLFSNLSRKTGSQTALPQKPPQQARARRSGNLFGGMSSVLMNDGDAETPNLMDWLMMGPRAPTTLMERSQNRQLFNLQRQNLETTQQQAERQREALESAIGGLTPQQQALARLNPNAWTESQFSRPETRVTQSGTFWRDGGDGPQILGRDPNWQPPAGMIYQPPAGYRGTPDGLRPIPGGPADITQTAEGRARAAQMDSSSRQLENAMSVLDEALPNVSGYSSGMVGQVLRGVGGSAAFDLDQQLEPVRAILSFESLAEMRRNSATGGALGSIAVRELELLGNTVRSLNTAQSEAQLRSAITATRAQLERTRDAMNAARSEMGGAQSAPAEGLGGDANVSPFIARPDSGTPSVAPHGQQGRVRVWNPQTGRVE